MYIIYAGLGAGASPNWEKLPRLSERHTPLGIMGDPINGTVKPPDIVGLWCWWRFRGMS